MSRIVKVRLGEADRAIYGCPEWMDVDLERLPVQEVLDLDEAGIDWRRLIEGEALIDPAAAGEQARDEQGRGLVKRNYAAINQVVVWKALRRNGFRLPIADLDFDLNTLEVLWPELGAGAGEGEGEGKDAAANSGGGSTASSPGFDPSTPD